MTVNNYYQIVLNIIRKAIMKIVSEHRVRSIKIHDDTTLPAHIQTTNTNIDNTCDAVESKDSEIKQIKLNLKNAYAEQRTNRSSLISLLKLQKTQLEGHFNFDKDSLSKYGFVVVPQGPGSPITEMPKVENLSLSYGDHPCSLDAHWDTVHGYHYYKIQICYLDPSVEANWSDFDTSDISSHTLEKLQSGKLCWVRVAVVGAEAQGVWSDPVSKMVP